MADRENHSYTKITQIKVESNTTERAVEITDSKVRLIYRDYVSNKIGTTLFSTSFAVFLSTLTTLLTSEFKGSSKIEGFSYVIKGIFLSVCVISAVLTLIGLVLFIRSKIKFNEDAFVDALHNCDDKTKTDKKVDID